MANAVSNMARGAREPTMRSSTPQTCDRRTFLQTLGSASTAAVVVVVAPISRAEAYNPGQGETAARYRETEHVKTFYRTNGYEGVKR
jgi:hypothetical protein